MGKLCLERGLSARFLVCNVKKIVKKVLDGTLNLPGKYNKVIEEATIGERA